MVDAAPVMFATPPEATRAFRVATVTLDAATLPEESLTTTTLGVRLKSDAKAAVLMFEDTTLPAALLTTTTLGDKLAVTMVDAAPVMFAVPPEATRAFRVATVTVDDSNVPATLPKTRLPGYKF